MAHFIPFANVECQTFAKIGKNPPFVKLKLLIYNQSIVFNRFMITSLWSVINISGRNIEWCPNFLLAPSVAGPGT